MKWVFAILMISLVFIVGCFSIKENQVDLSMMELEKIDTIRRYPEMELVYVWHIIDGERVGAVIYSYGKLNERYVPGSVAYVFVKRW